MKKELVVEVPEGFEIDEEKSNIVFKKIKTLPKTWGDLKEISGYYIDSESIINSDGYTKTMRNNENRFFSIEEAQASIALAQLSQLKAVYNDGWKPDYSNDEIKYVIRIFNNAIIRDTYSKYRFFLTFKSEKIRDEFLENFRDLIEQAIPLL